MITTLLQFLPLVVAQTLSRKQMQRIPEPDTLTANLANVAQYDQVMTTKLAIAYAVAMEMIYRTRPEPFGGQAIDLACGPGHFSINLARHLKLDELTGIDLSEPMVDVANRNAQKQELSNVQFRRGDITGLSDIPDNSFDLSTFTDAAHHMPDLETVSKVLHEMDRITKPNGLIFVMDLVRLKSRSLTERYVNLLGRDYVERGLPEFLEDFRNSMYAAWTADEMRAAVPKVLGRTWSQIVPRGLPTIQLLLGRESRVDALHDRRDCAELEFKVPGDLRAEWRLMRQSLQFATRRQIGTRG